MISMFTRRYSWRWPFVRKVPKITIGDLGIYAEHRLPQAFDEAIRYKRWVVVVVHDPNILGVVDHIKPNGQLGVRPVDPKTGKYWLNSSMHWALPDRIRIPEEWALYEDEVRNAFEKEIPKVVRQSQ